MATLGSSSASAEKVAAKPLTKQTTKPSSKRSSKPAVKRAAKPAPQAAAGVTRAASARPSSSKGGVKSTAAPTAAAAKSATPANKAAAKPIQADPSAKAIKKPKPPKQKQDKLVRDSFTMPEGEFKLIAMVKQRSMGFGRATKKSEVLRAGLKALQVLSDAQLQTLLESLALIKTGRPKKSD